MISIAREMKEVEEKKKSVIAKYILQNNPDLTRKEAIGIFMQGMEMSKEGSQTYYYTYREKPTDESEISDVDTSDNEEVESEAYPIEMVRQSLYVAAQAARGWYENRTAFVVRESFDSRGGLNDDGTGAVYSYFDEDNIPLYVGITSGKVKNRIYVKTSRHVDKPWWNRWKTMRFAQIADDVDRQLLEYLLIVAYNPSGNSKPKGKDLGDFLG